MSVRRVSRVALALLIVFIGAFVAEGVVHVHGGRALVPAEWRSDHPGPHAIPVTLVADRDWMDSFGDDAEAKARRVLEQAAVNFRRAGIHLRYDRFVAMKSFDSASLHDHLIEQEESVSPQPGGVVIGLSGRDYVGDVDGVARPRHPHVLVRHHARQPGRDAYVITHELGHVFGLHHHACPDGLCFMADHNYDPDEHWCPEHLELLRANGGYFQFLQLVGRQGDA